MSEEWRTKTTRNKNRYLELSLGGIFMTYRNRKDNKESKEGVDSRAEEEEDQVRAGVPRAVEGDGKNHTNKEQMKG